MQTSEYHAHANSLLESFGVSFSSTLVGDDCPRFCEDKRKDRDMDKLNTWPRKTHVHGKHYRVSFTRDKQTVSFDFWNSYADEFHNWAIKTRLPFASSYQLEDMQKAERKKGMHRFEPTAYDVLACLQKYPVGSFADFCGEFGYDQDSRQAEQTYHAVVEEYSKMQTFFTAEELEKLQDVQ